jgi:tetratricopeptide (TPR) repeat protein/tRNA A-37 threonylcarbamoyl transferase component Bud32
MLSPTGVVPIPAIRFDKYTLVARLGRGGMADVYLAIVEGPSGFRKLVALKRLREAYEDDARLVAMFMDEARLLARLEHPNLLHALDLGATDGRHFIAMEFLEGQTLARLLRRVARREGPLPVGLILHIASEVLDGLHHAHELTDFDGSPLGIVHRDVTPGNIVITYEGVVKLLDFGVAKSATQMVETEPDVRKGKFAYLSPEQIEGRIDRRSDLFSLGVILWEALAKQRLFDAESPARTIKKIESGPIPPLTSVCPELPSGLAAVVAKALKRNAAARYQTAQEMRAALEAIAVRDGLTMRRQDVAAFMTDLFADLRADHGRALSAAVTAGIRTTSGMFEVLGTLTTPEVAREEERRATEARERTAPTLPPPVPAERSWSRSRVVTLAAVASLFVFLLVLAIASGDGGGDAVPAAAGAATVGAEGAAEADPEARSSVERDLDAFEAERTRGREHYRAGRYEDAIVAYEAATRENPAHAGSFAGLGASYLAAGRQRDAVSAYQEAVRLAPTHSGFHAALGRAYRAAGRDDLAIESYEDAVRLDPDNRAARAALRELRPDP